MIPAYARQHRKQRSNHTVTLGASSCSSRSPLPAVTYEGRPSRRSARLRGWHGDRLSGDVDGDGQAALLEHRWSKESRRLWEAVRAPSSTDLVVHFLLGGILMVLCLVVLVAISNIDKDIKNEND